MFCECYFKKLQYQKKKAKSGHAEQAIHHIGQLYAVEREVTDNELSAVERAQLRLTKSKPVIDKFRGWLV